MAANALKKITAEAKRIRKRHPSQSWKSAVKEAGRKYRTGKISGVRRSGVKKKKVAKRPRKRVAGKAVKRHRVTHVEHYGVIGSLASHKKAVRHLLDERLSKNLLAIEKATTKPKKKKLLKKKALIKREMNAFR